MSAVPKLGAIVLDCPDPAGLARFYARLLDLPEPEVNDDDWVDLSDPGGVRVSFQRVESYRPPEWPGQDAPQQLHLDLDVTDLDAAHRRALSLGAKLLDDAPEHFRVYADPAGHPFCLCAC
ncbi:VOC family protein [Amycolatopsis endophytica]|uniref:Catechol 2,3-dioxygenase-like lactoylglutathione lyase family enzyme n=1 Tax=Amycolatopsis endophytica TaxID=860233 RepID=A0A853AZ66_9PSEU|nr:VOC family protein [Amycolatopsis endophytica]NYI88058.1 catechol 2,3-dioxygenase-like lactoylglutathione lyase family enzyme [Amycolatopsis endophytica]